jgi:hypothetical protein
MDSTTEIRVGIHLIANVYDVDPFLLEKLDTGLPLLKSIVHDLDLHVVSETGFQFSPVGYTYAFVFLRNNSELCPALKPISIIYLKSLPLLFNISVISAFCFVTALIFPSVTEIFLLIK